MSKGTLFISDLHLPAGPSPLRDRFIAFVDGPAHAAQALYILGDLFEVWLGDDLGAADYAAECAALRRLTDAGVPVLFQRGNRDFLVGAEFCAATGVRMLPDPCVIDLCGTPTLVSHGDLFCTGDVRYQRWRRFVNRPLTQRVLRALPEGFRRRLARGIRAGSSAETRRKPAEILDVSEAAVRAAFDRHAITRIIHGHTHRPAEHRYRLDGRACERIVIADWRPDRMEALRCDADGLRRVAA